MIRITPPMKTGVLIIFILVCFTFTVKVFALPATTSTLPNGPATIGYGSVAGGTYSDMTSDDGNYYSFQEPGTSGDAGYYLDIRFQSWQQLDPAIDVNTTTKIDLVLTGKVDRADDTYYVYLWDYVQSQWVQVAASLSMSTSDLTHTISVTSNITNYIDNGYIQAQIRCSGLVNRVNNAYDRYNNTILYIDHLRADFYYDDGVADTTPPQVQSTTPASGALDVDINTSLTAAFDEDLTGSTIDSVTFTVYDGTSNISGVISYNSSAREAVFVPALPLAYSTTYTATLTTGIQDLAGNGLAENYQWSFVTAAEGVDSVPPEVASVSPPDSSTDISTSTSVEATFSEAMDSATINGSTVYLRQGATTVTSTITYDAETNTAVLVPDSALAYNTTYTATLTTGASDLAGNGLETNYNWSFSTMSAPTNVPDVPTNVLAEGIGSTEIAVNWVPVTNTEGYYVYRSTSPDSGYVKVGSSVGQLATYFIDSDLDPDTAGMQYLPASTPYYYRVSAYNAIGESGLSINYTHTYTDETGQNTTRTTNMGTTYAPQVPRGIQLTPGPNMVTISWNANPEPNIVGYNVYRAEESAAEKGVGLVRINNEVITGTSFNDLTTADYFDYYYRVSVVDSTYAEGSLSAERHIRIESAAPAYVPHTDFNTQTEACAVCHVTHSAIGPYLINYAAEPELCFFCHDGTGSQNITYQEFSNPDYTSRHPVTAGPYTGDLVCTNCHNPHLNFELVEANIKTYPKILQQSHDNTVYYKGNEICYACHGTDSNIKGGDHETAFELGAHNHSMPNPASGTENKCMTCHLPHAAPNENLKMYKEENACFTCHYPDTLSPGAADIYALFTANPDSATHHDVFDADQEENQSKIECHNCHNPHGLTATYKATDPDNPAPAVLWTGIAEASADQPLEGTFNEFCVRCHDSSFPTFDPVTEPYAPSVTSGTEILSNISLFFYGSGSTIATDKHGVIDGQPKTMDTLMGYDNTVTAPNYVLACTKCHDPHGSINVYNLRSEVTSSDGTQTKRGLVVYSWVDSTGKLNADTRFFCNACHGIKHMGNTRTYPSDCFSGGNCHDHGASF